MRWKQWMAAAALIAAGMGGAHVEQTGASGRSASPAIPTTHATRTTQHAALTPPRLVRIEAPGDPVYLYRLGTYHWVPTIKILNALGDHLTQAVWRTQLAAPVGHALTLFDTTKGWWYWFDAKTSVFYQVAAWPSNPSNIDWGMAIPAALPYPLAGIATVTAQDTVTTTRYPATWIANHNTYFIQDVDDLIQVDTPQGDGTAWMSARGTWCTCWHVINGILNGTQEMHALTYRYADNSRTEGEGDADIHGQKGWGVVSAINVPHDLAAITPYLRTDLPTPLGLHWTSYPVYAGEPVMLMGYAGAEDVVTYSLGYIKKVSTSVRVSGRVGLQFPMIAVTNLATGGDSGGVLVNPWNQVVGVVESSNWNPALTNSYGSAFAEPLAYAGIDYLHETTPVSQAASVTDPIPWYDRLF